MTLRADSARVRARMLAAARARLAAGDMELPLNAIAKDAGVGVGTVYRHFAGRQALLESLAADSYRALIAEAAAAADNPDIADGLRNLVRAALRRQLADPALAAVLSTPECQCDETLALGRELGTLTMRVLDRARKAGVIRADIVPDDVRRLTCGLQHAVRSGGDEDGTAIDRYLDVLLRGLRP
ncbi:TetR family transcriptional regulator [Actinomadura sp. NBRC 104425]|uniref:TetR/AcrR family transcriptional regulator n=1 Tax=Actinomadura sp. NBRC 104425 TaxID=3032204 RepID=UPI0024A0871E|nr:helix-turn-helix domain-containing protein [Actinomadura sp. NBRC 104425]GLZ11599.1 TetR family transcriptional regulator [Actinomadura sp. NBRC 104425]